MSDSSSSSSSSEVVSLNSSRDSSGGYFSTPPESPRAAQADLQKSASTVNAWTIDIRKLQNDEPLALVLPDGTSAVVSLYRRTPATIALERFDSTMNVFWSVALFLGGAAFVSASCAAVWVNRDSKCDKPLKFFLLLFAGTVTFLFSPLMALFCFTNFSASFRATVSRGLRGLCADPKVLFFGTSFLVVLGAFVAGAIWVYTSETCKITAPVVYKTSAAWVGGFWVLFLTSVVWTMVATVVSCRVRRNKRLEAEAVKRAAPERETMDDGGFSIRGGPRALLPGNIPVNRFFFHAKALGSAVESDVEDDGGEDQLNPGVLDRLRMCPHPPHSPQWRSWTHQNNINPYVPGTPAWHRWEEEHRAGHAYGNHPYYGNSRSDDCCWCCYFSTGPSAPYHSNSDSACCYCCCDMVAACCRSDIWSCKICAECCKGCGDLASSCCSTTAGAVTGVGNTCCESVGTCASTFCECCKSLSCGDSCAEGVGCTFQILGGCCQCFGAILGGLLN